MIPWAPPQGGALWRWRRALAVGRVVVAVLLAAASLRRASAGELPVPCGGAACSGAATAWVTSGNALASQTDRALNITQTTDNVVLNWAAFNIGADSAVTFDQPSASAVAVNRIYQADPSTIFGALDANGRVYLINQNGILFGEGSTINVGALIASSLDITPAALDRGIARAFEARQPAFRAGATGAGSIVVGEGASITTRDGGQVLMFAPKITNDGVIESPDGQIILGAGAEVYLASSTDPNLRGLVVQVNDGGSVTNGSTPTSGTTAARIVANRGNVTLAGLAVNQMGRVSATTTVQENGSIRLVAQQGTIVPAGGTTPVQLPTRNGTLTLGDGSDTEVLPEVGNPETAVDSTAQPRSSVYLEGELVRLDSGAHVVAPGGRVDVYARSDPRTLPDSFAASTGNGRLVIAESAGIDVSGLEIELPIERNLVQVELRGNELRDSPEQRDGPLRGQTISVDARETGVRPDGTVWVGTPLADTSGQIATIRRTVGERSLTGGQVTLASESAALLLEGSVIDVSGGGIAYQSGTVETTRLLGADGRVYDAASADRDRPYARIVSEYVREHPRWGVTEVFPGFSTQSTGLTETGYFEGRDAGSLSLISPQAVLDGTLYAGATSSPRQRFVEALPGQAPLLVSNRVPLAGTLRVGGSGVVISGSSLDFVTAAIDFEPGLALPSFGQEFDPIAGALPTTRLPIRLRPELIHDSGFAGLYLNANGSVTLPAQEALELPPAGSLIVRAGRADVLGDVTISQGTIDLHTEPTTTTSYLDSGLTISTTAKLSVAGRWTNDDQRTGAPPGQLVAPNGGAVSLGAKFGALVLAPDSQIDISGGAWRSAEGDLVGGGGGTLSLDAQPSSGVAPVIVLGSAFSAFGLEHGGASVLDFPSICVACAPEPGAGTVAVSPAWFTEGGFEDVTFTTVGATSIGATEVLLRQRNWRLSDASLLAPSRADLRGLATSALLPDYLRRPVNLDLSGVDVSVAAGAHVTGDPGAALQMRATRQLVIDGAIDLPGGSLDLRLLPTLVIDQFLPAQGVWFGSGARIDLSGAVLHTPNDLGIRTGTLLEGGSVVVRADRGYVVTQPGSLIDVSGAAAELDILSQRGQTIGTTPIRVWSAAGSIDLTAAEGMVLGGTLRGAAPAATGGIGGTLRVTLDPAQRNEPLDRNDSSTFPLSERRIVVADQAPTLAVGIGTGVPGDLNGLVTVGAAQIEAGRLRYAGARRAAAPRSEARPAVRGLRGQYRVRSRRRPVAAPLARIGLGGARGARRYRRPARSFRVAR